MSKETIYLIDGANYIYRAYYAIRHLSTSKGFPTNALYGFTQMILKFLREKKPHYMAVVFDTPEPTFRDEMYEDYKATREAPPDDLVEQFPHFKPLLEALSIPIIEKPGFEADDVIGTIAKKCVKEGCDVVILSGDKDLMQLVSGSISIFDSMKDLEIDEKQVREYFGVDPSQVIEVLGLAGDSSDNVPGVPGVGRKTAAKLINQYGSIKNLIAHLDELSEGLAQKIKENKKQLELSKKLVTLKNDVPLQIELDALFLNPPQVEKMRKLFAEFEFTKLISELAPQSTVDRSGYKSIDSEEALQKLIEKIKKAGCFSLDLETTSLDVIEAKIVGISVSTAPGEAAYMPVGHATLEFKGQLALAHVLDALKFLLEDPSIKKVGQNLKYDLSILKRHGLNVQGVYLDTMIASYLLNPGGQHNLDALSLQYLGHNNIKYEDLVGKGAKQKNFSEVPVDLATEYSCEDADVALRLAEIFSSKLKDENLEVLLFDLEMPLIPVLLDMELKGMKIDTASLTKFGRQLEGKLKDLENKIYKEAGEEFNVNSPRQLGIVIFEKLKLGTPKRTKTGYSTNIAVLDELASSHSLPALVLEYRSLSKLKSTYIDAMLKLVNRETGRVHTSFNQTVTATGRLSSSNPNLQNIPVRGEDGKKIRQAFIADEGYVLVSADYSQIELRVLAHLSKDKALLEAFGKGEDVHRLTAAGIFNVSPEKVNEEQRAVGKTVNFATIYGQGPYGLSRQLNINVTEAARYIDAYFKRYPSVEKYREKILKEARKKGFVETMSGRRRYVADVNSKNMQVKQAAERMAFNSVFQGTAADIIKKAMIEIHEKMNSVNPKASMLMQVHDELVFEVPKNDAASLSKFAKEMMEGAASLDVPLVVDVGEGQNWAEAH